VRRPAAASLTAATAEHADPVRGAPAVGHQGLAAQVEINRAHRDQTGPRRSARREDASAGASRYPQPSQEVALSNQYWVCSSVQPGTAKRARAVTPWPGRTMTCWRVRKCTVGGLKRCTVAASAEAHRVINRPKAKAERIATAPIDLPPFCAGGTARLTRRERSQHRTAWRGARASWDRFSGRLWGLEEKLPAVDHVVRAAITPSCSGFTIGQIGGIMGICTIRCAAAIPMHARKCRHIYYSDVHVGTIAIQSGIPHNYRP
jgi:hypothetical protein